MPRFSLVVPTLRRADTFERTLETLVAQPGGDFEVVVQNNGNDPATRDVVAKVGDARIRHFQTNDVRPMVENWDLALEHCTGDYVMFIGDDDGVMPDACAIAASVFDRNDAEILTWEPFLYLWPGFYDPRRANRLLVPVNSRFDLQSVAAASELERFYEFAVHYSKLPMIYHSFIARSLIDRVRSKHGRYFFGSLPDVTSAVVNAASVERYLRSTRPLSGAGLSHNSGGQHLTRAGADVPQQELARDFPRLHAMDDVATSGNLELMIGREMEIVKEEFLGERVQYDERRLVHSMARAINDAPERYDRTRAAILEMMDRLGLGTAEVVIPDRVVEPAHPTVGAHQRGPYETLFVIDCEALGIRSVVGATRLAAQLVPGIDVLDAARVEELAAEAPPLSSEPLGFGKGERGNPALASGWAEAEAWGAWSIEPEAVLRFRGPRERNGPLRLGIRYRSIALPAGGERAVECRTGGKSLASWSLSERNYCGEFVVELEQPTAESFDLTFVNHDLCSPFELGTGADTRLLGLGVEEVRLLSDEP